MLCNFAGSPRRRSAGLLVSAWLFVGCTGDLEGPLGSENCATCPQLSSPTTRLPRLSHAQWTETVEDLLAIDDASPLSATLLSDATRGFFDNDGAELRVDGTLWGDYQAAAESAAELATSPRRALRRRHLPITHDSSSRTSFRVRIGGRSARTSLHAMRHSSPQARRSIPR